MQNSLNVVYIAHSLFYIRFLTLKSIRMHKNVCLKNIFSCSEINMTLNIPDKNTSFVLRNKQHSVQRNPRLPRSFSEYNPVGSRTEVQVNRLLIWKL
jgi:hypothetical protein